MEPSNLAAGDIVQVDPAWDHDRGRHWFGGCLLVVSECHDWGVTGYVQSPAAQGVAYYRCPWEHMEPTGGKAPWVVDPK
jgi:hypothetical protein